MTITAKLKEVMQYVEDSQREILHSFENERQETEYDSEVKQNKVSRETHKFKARIICTEK
jgi:RecA-family ATPase